MGMLVLLLILASVLWFRYANGGRYRMVVDEALGWGFKLGGIGFLLGFVGPIILAPDANQGPLLGFITGPIGFVAGVIFGLVRNGTRRA